MSKVKVSVDQNGHVIHVSENNPDYGWIFVEQQRTIMEGGWLKKVNRKARIMGLVEDLKDKEFAGGAELSGQIIVIESLTPFNQENPDLDLKIAGDTGVICRFNDQPIYRQSFYTSNTSIDDQLIQHTNADEIKEVLVAQKEMDAIRAAGERLREPNLNQ